MPSPPLPTRSSQSPASVNLLEEQLDAALQQVESTKRLYHRLHEHNDEMEGEFLRLRGALEVFRNRLHFGVRNDVSRLRSELDSVRETVVFHTASFQRELHALDRVLHSALSTGSVMACDHEILYSGSGRVTLPMPSKSVGSGKTSVTVAPPPPVSWLHSPSSTKRGLDAAPANPLERERERARLILSTSVEDPPRADPPQAAPRRAISAPKRRSTKRHLHADGGVVSPREANNSSIEFFSDPETEAGSRSSKVVSEHPSVADSAANTKTTPAAFVLQAADMAQQRAVAERQTKKVSELTDVVAQMNIDRGHLQSKLEEQDHKFQSYLKQMKDVHKEETATLRSQLDMMTAALMGQRRSATSVDNLSATEQAELDASAVPPASSGASPATSRTSVKRAAGKTPRAHSARSAAKRREEAEQVAHDLVEERHRLGLSPPEPKPTDIVRDGLWAQRVLEQRTTNSIVVRPLFKPGTTPNEKNRSSSSGSYVAAAAAGNGRHYSDRVQQQPAFKRR
ncbi:Hypothetical protein, putative [Bodo saltans]|uniref:Uncharacterized protein n=1 Tax=Bodo saltans TaxID=75058 RepID=A0A0S4IPR1_BODSA|nr:Hypothetical protein, putative [Bodo saltans]|eukprot:CUF12992.1 Hypothetical protein, putative [Bodo saltans]